MTPSTKRKRQKKYSKGQKARLERSRGRFKKRIPSQQILIDAQAAGYSHTDMGRILRPAGEFTLERTTAPRYLAFQTPDEMQGAV